ncbi:MAG: DnaJ domain [Thermoanaerobaculia bacterium]|jgi:hypothetical protein|nr:DnaJ domain [Thermoanaerobaculia bacterium]
MDALEVLGLSSTANLDEIDRRRKILLLRLHPDKSASEEERLALEAQTKRINTAWDTLRKQTAPKEPGGEGDQARSSSATPNSGTDQEPWRIARNGAVVGSAPSGTDALRLFMKGSIVGTDYLFHSSFGQRWVSVALVFAQTVVRQDPRGHAMLTAAPWALCGIHGCSCNLQKGCLERSCDCVTKKFCPSTTCDCGLPRVCPNPTCDCQTAKIVTEAWGKIIAPPSVWSCSGCNKVVPQDSRHCPYCGGLFGSARNEAPSAVPDRRVTAGVLLTLFFGLFSFVWKMAWSLARSVLGDD